MGTQIIPRKTVTDLEQIFSTPPPKVIGHPNQPLVLAEDIAHAVTVALAKSNRIARIDEEGYPLPLHRVYALDDGVDGYGIPSNDAAGESFDFVEFTSNL